MRELKRLWEEIHPELPSSAEALQQRVYRVRKLGGSSKRQPGGDDSQASQEVFLRCHGRPRKPLPSVVEEVEEVEDSNDESRQQPGNEGDPKPGQDQWNSDGLREGSERCPVLCRR